MMSTTLKRSFESIGARIQIKLNKPPHSRFFSAGDFSIDIGEDKKGEFFDIDVKAQKENLEFHTVDIQKSDRHLLLIVRSKDESTSKIEKQKFLCGHDERHWFVAAVPESAFGVCSVAKAKEALKPDLVVQAQDESKVRKKNRNRRKNKGYLRQGEWFFLPTPDIAPKPLYILNNEPITRGAGGKPHTLEYVYRIGGEKVYVSRQHPNGLTEKEYRTFLKGKPKKSLRFSVMMREPRVYAKGKVSHADHKTILLDGWHLVLMNTENQARARANVAFLD